MAYQRQRFAQATCPVLTTRRRSVPPKTDSSAPHLRQHLKWPHRHLTWRTILTAVNVLFLKHFFWSVCTSFPKPTWVSVKPSYTALWPRQWHSSLGAMFWCSRKMVWNAGCLEKAVKPRGYFVISHLGAADWPSPVWVDVCGRSSCSVLGVCSISGTHSITITLMCGHVPQLLMMVSNVGSEKCMVLDISLFSFCFIICMLMHISNKFKEEELDVFVFSLIT